MGNNKITCRYCVPHESHGTHNSGKSQGSGLPKAEKLIAKLSAKILKATHCGGFLRSGGSMYAGAKRLRNPQPSKEAVRELIVTDVRERRQVMS